MDPFVHLHVASGYSLKYGASHPRDLVARAVDAEMDTLALTDRDGVYGAVRFAKACLSAGVRPILGVDLAIEPSGLVGRSAPVLGRRRTPIPSVDLPARANRSACDSKLSTVDDGKASCAGCIRKVNSAKDATFSSRRLISRRIAWPNCVRECGAGRSSSGTASR